MDLQRIVRALGQYPGRDKFLRAIYAALVILSTKIKNQELSKNVLLFAKQISSARLIFRQCNHPSMILATNDTINDLSIVKDKIDYTLSSTVTGLYTIYGYTELIAWLSDAKLLNFDAVKWFKYCLYLWLTALLCGMIRMIRNIYKKPWNKSKNDRISFIGFLCDFIAGGNGLPKGYLWSGKLSTRQASSLSFIASCIGFWKIY